jgi:hypothetical protein
MKQDGIVWRTGEVAVKRKQKQTRIPVPVEIPDAEHELVIERAAAIDVAKASGKVCVWTVLELPEALGSRHLGRGDRLMVALLVFDRRSVLDRRVESGRVVPVHPGGGFPFQLGPTGEGRMLVDQLRLIQSDSGFHQRVVQGVADAADRPGDPGLAQRLGERDRRVLAARVAVKSSST